MRSGERAGPGGASTSDDVDAALLPEQAGERQAGGARRRRRRPRRRAPQSGRRVDAGVQHLALRERAPQRPVQPVLEVELAAPLDDVGEHVAVEGRVLGEQHVEVERRLMVMRWSSCTCVGGIAAHSRVLRPWSGYGRPSPTARKITGAGSAAQRLLPVRSDADGGERRAAHLLERVTYACAVFGRSSNERARPN